MLTLCMDTSHRFLTLGLIQEDEVIASIQMECHKRQSESILPQLQNLFQIANYTPQDVKQVVVTKGPGSYTGIRIAMTIAKLMCTSMNIPLFTLSSLCLFSGGYKNTLTLLDARGGRVYYAHYDEGKLQDTEMVGKLEELKAICEDTQVMGDRYLLELEEIDVDYAQAFLDCRAFWELNDNAHLVVPEYLKKNDDYMVKK